MHFGLAVSILLHVGVLAWALVSMATTPPLAPSEPQPVEVSIVTADEVVRLKQGDRTSKRLEAKAAPTTERGKSKQTPPRPKQTAAPPPPPPPPPPASPPSPPEKSAKSESPPEPKRDPIAEKLATLAPPPEPGPGPEELKRAEEQKRAEEEKQRIEAEKKAEAEKQRIEAEKKAEAEKKRKAELEHKRREALKKKREEAKRLAEAKKKAAEKARKSFEDEMAEAIQKSALRDLDPTKKPPPAGGAAEPSPTAKTKGPTAGAPEGRDDRLTASQRAMIAIMMKQAVSRCWNINSGLEGVDKIVVELEVRLTPDGRLDGPPKVVNSGPGVLFADAANSALRALEQCQPYDLPREYYQSGWRHMIVDFRPERNF